MSSDDEYISDQSETYIDEGSCTLIKEGGFGTERSNLVCNKTEKIVPVRELITPYYKEIAQEVPGPAPIRNYSTYHLFCLKKNITPMVHLLNSDYSVSLCSKKNGEIMSIVIEVYSGKDYVQLNDEEYNYISESMEQALNLYPMCLIYDTNIYDSRYRGKYHGKWINDLLTDFYSVNPKYKIIEGRIYSTTLVDKMNHDQVWERKYLKIDQMLEDAFNKGIIYLSPGRGQEGFVKAWNMIPYHKGKNVYYPDWKVDIVKDKISFLYDKMRGEYSYVYYDGRTSPGWRKVEIRTYSDMLLSVMV
jgi:hypothetical protein